MFSSTTFNKKHLIKQVVMLSGRPSSRQNLAMEELINMGFSKELASQALIATGPNSSIAAAADWILTHSSSSMGPTSSSVQSSLDRFFTPKSPNNPKRPKPDTATATAPLAERMRPSTLAEILGQDHLLPLLTGPHLPSLILWGPPGSGKTSIARALSPSLSLSAVTASLSDLRAAIATSRKSRPKRTVLFVDEIHRFSKPHLDVLLPAIEDGTVILIGATTENPSFHLTTPLLSRSRVLSLSPLSPHHIQSLIQKAQNALQSSVNPSAAEFLSLHCDGDARVALNALESAAAIASGRTISIADVKEVLQCKHLAYDRDGDEHYNLISALHKSMRGSDADAAIYWLARMLEGGEKPLYIARRLVRFASEDVGLADPAAVGHAVACYQACHFIGQPECDVNLVQCVAYLAVAPKSVAVYRALGEARRAVRESVGGNEGAPLHMWNAPTKMMEFGYGEGYLYPPDHPESARMQSYLPTSLQGRKFLDWPPVERKME